MSGERSDATAAFGAALAGLPEPELPAGLKARIVAQATALPQQPRRDSIVAAVPATVLSAPVARFRARPIWAGAAAAAMAIAASAAALLLHVPSTGDPKPGESALALDAAAAAAQKSSVSRSADTSVPAVEPKAAAQLADAEPEHTPRQSVRSAKVAPAPTGTEQIAPVAPSLAPVAPPAPTDGQSRPLQEQRLAETAEPPRPVQGPPVPDDLLTPIGDGASGTGLGIAGSARPASPPPVSRPSPGAGGPPRR